MSQERVEPSTMVRNPRAVSPIQWLRTREAGGVLIALIILCLVLSLATPNFVGSYNISIVLRQASFVGLIALGQTLVLLLGGIDLSVGAAAGLSAIVGALLVTLGLDPSVAFLSAILFGFVIGSVNGFFIAVVKLNPFIVTLASWQIFAGAVLVITQGYPIGPLGPGFQFFGSGDFLGLPSTAITFIVIAVVMAWLLRFTRFGRDIYAIVGNREAARLVGIPVVRIELLVYGIAGALSALAGTLYASRMNSAGPSVGADWLMGAITAAIIGGTSLKGGQGTILGTVLGTLLMAVLGNGMALVNVSGYWVQIVIGAVVLMAVLVDRFRVR